MRLANQRPHRLRPAQPAHTRNRKVHAISLRPALSFGPQSRHTPAPTRPEPAPTAYKSQAPYQREFEQRQNRSNDRHDPPHGLRFSNPYPASSARAAVKTVATAITGHRPPIHIGANGPCQRPPNIQSSPKLCVVSARRKNMPIKPLTTRYAPSTHHRMPSVCRFRCTRGRYIGIGGGG